MEVNKMLEQLNSATNWYEVNEFNGLCDKAKVYFFDWIMSCDDAGLVDAIRNCCIINSKGTPIEQIFTICYHNYVDKFVVGTVNGKMPLGIVLDMELMEQYPIECGKNNYIADYVIDFSKLDGNNLPMYPAFNKLKYVIELDGFDYHSTKKQVNYDYEREQQLQMLGYKVVRFTGSQVFNKPYSCVHKLLTIVLNDMQKEIEKNGSIES